MFDWTINFGHVLTVVAFILTGWGLVNAIKARVDVLADRMKSVEVQMQKIVEVLVGQARQEERMNSIDARMVVHAQRMSEIDRQVDRLFEPGVTIVDGRSKSPTR